MFRTIVLAALLIIPVSYAVAEQQPRKPIKEALATADYAPPPKAVNAMISEADAVVVARFTGDARPIERAFPGVPTLESTMYAFEVVDIVKLHPLLPYPGGHLELELLGGDKEYATYILRTRLAETDLLEANSKYVLFLKLNPRTNELGLAWGPAGVYDITTGRVRSLRRTSRHHDGKAEASFLRELRSSRPAR